jgi:hypothetical protein
LTLKVVIFKMNQEENKVNLQLMVAQEEFKSMVGERRFELPTSASRTLRANQAALLPGASIL